MKLHSRCDLACDYCYLYAMADQRWRARPLVMAEDTVGRLGARIAEHALAHRLSTLSVVLHGGEPLLAGPDRIGHCVRTIRSGLPAGTAARFIVQTNGVRLGPAFLDLFAELDVGVGVSLDGDATAHDRHRRRTGGSGASGSGASGSSASGSSGSHQAVVGGLRLLTMPRWRPLFRGLLCVVDLANPPLDTFRELLAWQPPAIDLLLPHGNWSAPPPGRTPDAGTPYADWLITVFDSWYAGMGAPTRIRLFDEIIAVLLGGVSRLESIGTGPAGSVVIETDGAIERSDTFASAADGSASTGLSIADSSFDQARTAVDGGPAGRSPGGPCAQCGSCELVRVCGGGLPAHRYRDGGFANPSVYCPDLYRLIRHIRAALRTDVAGLLAGSGGAARRSG